MPLSSSLRNFAPLYSSVRTLGTAFIILSGIGALADDRGGGISQRIMVGGGGGGAATGLRELHSVDPRERDAIERRLVVSNNSSNVL